MIIEYNEVIRRWFWITIFFNLKHAFYFLLFSNFIKSFDIPFLFFYFVDTLFLEKITRRAIDVKSERQSINRLVISKQVYKLGLRCFDSNRADLSLYDSVGKRELVVLNYS